MCCNRLARPPPLLPDVWGGGAFDGINSIAFGRVGAIENPLAPRGSPAVPSPPKWDPQYSYIFQFIFTAVHFPDAVCRNSVGAPAGTEGSGPACEPYTPPRPNPSGGSSVRAAAVDRGGQLLHPGVRRRGQRGLLDRHRG